MAKHDPWQWPALQGMPATLPAKLEYQRGVFGKVHGVRSDFRWIARSADFKRGNELEEALYLGSQDKPCALPFWRCLAAVHYAGFAYPSRAKDAAQRGGFLEKQIADLGRSVLPAALSALLSLRMVWQWNDSIWWDRQESVNWSQPDSVLPIAAADCPGLDLEGLGDRLGKAIAEGLAGLMELGKESLAYFYASLLAGETPAILPSTKPLGPEALAALLLPLPRPLADRLSLLGWVPSNLYELKDLGKCWDGAVLAVGHNAPELSSKAKEYQAEAERMADAIYAADPDRLRLPSPVLPAPASTDPQDDSLQLAIWGPSSAGKTVLMAQLFLENAEKESDWLIVPNETSLQFIQNMRQSRGGNGFPPATPENFVSQLRYQFFNRTTGISASLLVEERPGRDYEKQKQDIRQRMKSADGLVLLIDPYRESRKLDEELANLFTHMQVDRQGIHPQDTRPIAVCLSKADDLINNPADLRHAMERPDDFVKTRDRWGLVPLFGRYCANYRFFPVSAVGVGLRHGIAESNTFYDENLKLRVKGKSQSFNLMAPFIWLIDQLRRARI
ncbi:MAG: hypothetical protein DM484_02650 [Candidatus Methylumidiphilus alinenensis]|uniref:Double-GTPase 2 domain-containing protein n=1 Tax=Candidatus Methylumidiphilus alinenensis TaxID=2202197 RepID=A0A2W4RNL9_9GAMM|nr:MAG: hypothetical protein DM484_02650 [Candidatus Methylumidiphilus alinenensis]